MQLTGPDNVLIEACCGSYDDVAAVAAAGVRRVELNSSLFLGGLTPSAGCTRLVKEKLEVETIAMIRPREGGFMYSGGEFETMLRDIDLLSEVKADGFVFGVLHADGSVDLERNRQLIERAGGRPCVFHRAFDVVPDRFEALEQLVDLGFVRVLTKGGCQDVREATAHLAALIEHSGERITILPGGVKPYFAADFVARTGARELHVAGFVEHEDPSCSGNPTVHFGGALHSSETLVKRFDAEWIAGFGSG